MTLEKLNVILDANLKPYKQAMKSAETETTKSTAKIKSTLSSIKGTIAKIGAVVASAFAVKALVNFSKSCIELGSDLAEVQNVVDVTFGSMSGTINQFAREAIEKFGLSETAAKRYTSTMGAMLKSMGFTTQQAADMSMNITGLAADMASFYNLDNDVAFEKIRAGLSGETEPLKQLGINMSVANLEAYAMSQGITTAYNKLDQASQAALRYNYLLSVTADAQGDFARTSDGWANQVRVLQERWNALKATLGQAFIAALTPVLQMLNKLISYILAASDAFSNFISKVTGSGETTKSSFTDAGGAVGALGDAAAGAGDSATDAADDSAAAAKKAKKEAQRTIASFDELHVLSKKDDDSDSSGGGVSPMASGISTAVDAASDKTESKLNPVLDKLANKLKELQKYFMKGWNLSFGTVDLGPLQKAAAGVKQNLKEIWTDPGVVGAANNWANRTAQALGQIAGAVASIGVTIATNLVGGFNRYLSGNKERIKRHLISMFDITGDINEIIGNFATAFADIFSVFGGENGQRVTASIIGIFSDAFMGVLELATKIVRDIADVITAPFVQNREKIKDALDGTLGVIASVLETIKELVDGTVDKLNEVYDQYINPLLMSIKDGFADTFGKLLDVYNTYFVPVFDRMAEKLRDFKDAHLQPMIDAFLELIGQVASTLQTVWENILKPFVDWLVENIFPKIAPLLEAFWDKFLMVWGFFIDAIHALWDTIKSVFKLIQDLIEGDWAAAWQDCKDIVVNLLTAVWDFIVGIGTGIYLFFYERWLAIKFVLQSAWQFIKDGLSGLGKLIRDVFNSLKEFIINLLEKLRTGAKKKVEGIKSAIVDPIRNAKDTAVRIFNELKDGLVDKLDAAREAISNIIDRIRNLFDFQFSWPHVPMPHFTVDPSGWSIGDLLHGEIPWIGVDFYAAGGFPEVGHMFVAGEAGPEMVGRIGPRNAVVNNEQIVESVAMGVADAVSQVMMGVLQNMNNSDGGSTPVVINLDSETVYRGVLRGKRKYESRLQPDLQWG